MKMLATCVVLTSALAVQGSAWAALSDDEAARLGKDLLPWGAEKAGNADGTIPPYGAMIPVPAGFKLTVGGERPDPFAGEKPLYSITAQNMAQYQDKLSAGVQAMLKKYPSYRLDIYPTHRTAKYPQYVIDNTLKNAKTCPAAGYFLGL